MKTAKKVRNQKNYLSVKKTIASSSQRHTKNISTVGFVQHSSKFYQYFDLAVFTSQFRHFTVD